ncbi:hypothetical protein ElyMa_001536000 [Elysia marginata]|uniref:Uncharacterized protein n=1 Tax=Elysia marginata TaxID=1093978 RepID=A0AAV4J898_9GAST|nr:hypothetical protein ElyMa_001536000 [Elysia marginata]
MQTMLKHALQNRNCSKDAQILRQAANIVRKDLLDHQGFKFAGTFSKQSQEKSVPMSAESLVTMILNGPNIKHQSKCDTQTCLTACQIMLHNTKKEPTSHVTATKHSLEREPPLPIYIGLKVHTACRSRKLIEQLYKIGVCVSYDRVLQLGEWMAASACERFEEDGVVAPVCLRKGLFIVAAIDNLNHNPTATTATSSFHGTGISLFQMPTKDNIGIELPPLKVPSSGQRNTLPKNYTEVPAVALQTNTVSVPECGKSPIESCIDYAKEQKKQWSDMAVQLFKSDQMSCETTIS